MKRIINVFNAIKLDPPPGALDPNANPFKSGFEKLFLWAGIVAVVMTVIAGFMYIAAAGNPDKVRQAKNMILFTLVGLFIVMMSFAIVNLVVKTFGG